MSTGWPSSDGGVSRHRRQRDVGHVVRREDVTRRWAGSGPQLTDRRRSTAMAAAAADTGLARDVVLSD